MKKGYVLYSPSGKAVPETFSVDLQECQAKAFNALYRFPRRGKKHWTNPYWKQWDEFITARVKRGWQIRVVDFLVGVFVKEDVGGGDR